MERRPSLVPDLYHIKRTNQYGGVTRIEVCGTYTDPSTAEEAGLNRLLNEGRPKSSFTTYDENKGQKDWKYEASVLLHAEQAAEGSGSAEVWEVEVETTPNSLGVRARPGGRVEESLFYVLQKTETAKMQTLAIRGIHLSRQAAVNAARHELLDHEVKKDWYSEYDEAAPRHEEEGGEEVIVRAVGPEGQRYIVSVLHEA